MRRYVALLRGVSPMNAKMPALKNCFERAGFEDVKTVLSSGNVVFSSRARTSVTALEAKVEDAMTQDLDRSFLTIVRPVETLRELLDADPYAAFRFPADAKRVVTFLKRAPRATLTLPLEFDGARILCVDGGEVFTAYVPSTKGGAFMTLLERTFGKDITTRTWDTVKKVAR